MNQIKVTTAVSIDAPVNSGAKDLAQIIDGEIQLAVRQFICQIRVVAGHDDERSKIMKKQLPIWMPSGIFDGGRTAKDLKVFSGLMCIDYDRQDNPGMTPDDMKAIICCDPSVYYCGLSTRGLGVYALVRVPQACKDNNVYAAHYRAFAERMAKSGLIADKLCGTVAKARFVSFDENPYYNDNAQVFSIPIVKPVTRTFKQFRKKMHVTRPTAPTAHDYQAHTFQRCSYILEQAANRGIDIAPTQNDWYRCGCAFANTFGEGGRVLFMQLSDLWTQCTGQEQRDDPSRKYDECLASQNNDVIGLFFHRAEQVGILAKGIKQPIPAR